MANIFTIILDIDSEPTGLTVHWKSVSPGTEQAAEGSTFVPEALINSDSDVYDVCEAEAVKQFAGIKLASDRTKSPTFGDIRDKSIRLR